MGDNKLTNPLNISLSLKNLQTLKEQVNADIQGDTQIIHLKSGQLSLNLEKVLELGEPFFDTENNVLYVGDNNTTLENLDPISGTVDVATTTEAGLMSALDKQKLDNIAEQANRYIHPTTSGNKHIPAGGSAGQILRWSEDGTAVWGEDSTTTYTEATTSVSGLLASTDKTFIESLKTAVDYSNLEDGVIPDLIVEKATTTSDGLLSKEDKSKLNGIADNANNYTHPTLDATAGVETGNQTPNFGETFNISQVVSNAGGHVTRQETRTVTIPDTKASTSDFGLMKVGTNLTVNNGIVSVENATTSTSGAMSSTDKTFVESLKNVTTLVIAD